MSEEKKSSSPGDIFMDFMKLAKSMKKDFEALEKLHEKFERENPEYFLKLNQESFDDKK